MNKYLANIRRYDGGLADLIAQEFGENGYAEHEINVADAISSVLLGVQYYSRQSFPIYIADLKLSLLPSRTMSVDLNGRQLKLTVLSSNPNHIWM